MIIPKGRVTAAENINKSNERSQIFHSHGITPRDEAHTLSERAAIIGMNTSKAFSCDRAALADISEYAVDTTLPPLKRMLGFIGAVGDPYAFRVGDVGVTVQFGHGRTLTELLAGVIGSA